MKLSIRDALAGGGQLLAGAALLIGAVGGVALENQVSPADQLPNLSPVASSPSGFRCPSGYEQTNGTDPDTQSEFVTCDNGRIIVTKRDGGEPVAFDTLTGRFLSQPEMEEIR